jgi:transposase
MDDKDGLIEILQAENKNLREEIEQLKDEIAQMKKDSGTSSKPPSSDIVKPVGVLRRLGSKRRRGGQLGHRKFSRQPFSPKQVDKVIPYELNKEQARGLEPLNVWHVVQQVKLPTKMFRVVEHRARKYRHVKTGRIVIASMPAAVRRGGLLGPKITALMAFLKSGCHCSFSTIQRYCREVMGLSISRGMLSKMIRKTAKALQRPYERLRARLPHEPNLGADETGHHDNGKLHWA